MSTDPFAVLDALQARHGSLAAQERMLKRRRLAAEEMRLQAEEAQARAALELTATPAQQAAPTQTAPRRGSKGTAEATLIAVRALAAVVHGDSRFPRKAQPLAKRAAERAQELGLAGADALNPGGSSMREIAAAFLAGIEAEERE